MYNEPASKTHTKAPALGALQKIVTSLKDAGCKIPAPITKAVSKLEGIQAHIDQTVKDAQDTQALQEKAVQALADGKATPQHLLEASLGNVATKHRDNAYATLYRQLADRGKRKAQQPLYAAMQAPGDDWITKIMRPRVTELITVLRDADIPEYPIDLKAQMHALEPVASRPDIAAAWSDLTDIYSAAEQLRIIACIPSRLDHRHLYEFAGDPTERQLKHRSFSVWTYYCRNGHEPGIYTQEEVDQHLDQHGIIRADTRRLQQEMYDEMRKQSRMFT